MFSWLVPVQLPLECAEKISGGQAPAFEHFELLQGQNFELLVHVNLQSCHVK